MEEIKAWLINQDYHVGVGLMLMHHPNKGLCRNLAKVETSQHKEMLRYELSKLAKTATTIPIEKKQIEKVVKTEPQEIATAEFILSQTLNTSEIEEIEVKQGKLYNKRAMLSNQLVDLSEEAGQEERKLLVDQILDVLKEYNRLAALKREWQQSGEIKSEEAIEIIPENLNNMSKDQLVMERANIRSNLSKVKNSIRNYQHQPAKVVTYKEKEARLKARLDQIEAILIKQ